MMKQCLLIACSLSMANTHAQEYENILPDSLYQSFNHLVLHTNHKIPYSRTEKFSLEVCDTCSMFSSVIYLEDDRQDIWVGGDNTYILDVETGERYAARKALHGFKLNQINIAKDHKGKIVAYQIEFPLISQYVKTIKIYGMPELGLNGERDFSIEDLQPIKEVLPEYSSKPLVCYEDQEPLIKIPDLIRTKKTYLNSDSTTYPVYRNLQKVYPLLENDLKEHSTALFTTKDATYITQIIECKEPRTIVRIANGLSYLCYDVPDDCNGMFFDEYVRQNGMSIVSTDPYPMDKTFVIEGTPGDFVVIAVKFPPIPIGADKVTFELSCSGIGDLYNEAVQFYKTENSISFLRNNQKYVRLMPDNKTHIIK